MIHTEHPFLPDPADRDSTRRFRGRLAAPVTIVTAGSGENRAGLTVSSLFVVEGDPPRVHILVGPTTDLWDVAGETGRFVVHIGRDRHRQLAEVFAGLSPSPGGIFASFETTESDYGPTFIDLEDRVYCTVLSLEEVGYSGLMVGQIDQVEVSDLEDPLVHFRSRYRRLA